MTSGTSLVAAVGFQRSSPCLSPPSSRSVTRSLSRSLPLPLSRIHTGTPVLAVCCSRVSLTLTAGERKIACTLHASGAASQSGGGACCSRDPGNTGTERVDTERADGEGTWREVMRRTCGTRRWLRKRSENETRVMSSRGGGRCVVVSVSHLYVAAESPTSEIYMRSGESSPQCAQGGDATWL